MRSLARNVGSLISTAKLAAEISAQEANPIKAETLEGYLQIFRDLMVVEDLEPWAPHLRSSYVVRASAKRYFVDPAFAVAAMDASPTTLLRDLNTLGFLFENLVIRDLRIFAQNSGGTLAHYRDSTNLEADVIVKSEDGRWGAVEIKLNPSDIDAAVVSLQKVVGKVDQGKKTARRLSWQ